MQEKQSISRNLSINTLSTILIRSIGFITVPIVSRILSPADNGLIANYNTWLAFLGVFIGLQSHGTLMNANIFYTKNEYVKYRSSVMFLSFVSFIIAAIPLCIFPNAISNLLNIPVRFLPLLILQYFGGFCIGFLNADFIAHKKALYNMILSILLSVCTITFSITLAKQMADASFGYILGISVVNALLGFVIFIYILSKGRVLFNKTFWKFCLLISTPLIFHALSGNILASSDRIMIRKLKGAEALAIYSLNYNIVAILAAIWSAISSAWIPFYFDYLAKNDHEEMIVKSKNLIKVFLCLCIGFILVSPEVFQIILPSTYWDGIKIIPMIVSSYFFLCLYSFASNYEFFHRKTIWVAIGSVISGLLNIGLNFILIPRWGYMGASFATLLSYISLFLFHEFIARNIIKGYSISFRMYIPGISILILAVVLFYVFFPLWILRWLLAILVGIYLIRHFIKEKSII